MRTNTLYKVALLFIALILLDYPMRGVAEDKDVYPAGESYEADENSEHDLSNNVSKFSYGSASRIFNRALSNH